MHNFSISRVVSNVSRPRFPFLVFHSSFSIPRFPFLVFHSPFSVPEVNLSAMSGYLAPSNVAETQFDDDETGEYDAEQDSEESFIRYYFFQRL